MRTRPSISWSDLAGAEVGLWGLGVEGGANLRRLLAMGTEPVLVDDRPDSAISEGRPVLATAEGGLDALGHCDVVVKTPGISRYRPDVETLVERGIPVVGGLGLWLEEADRTRVVCVTGTKGKSTTTAISGHLLTGLGHRCFVGGNLGRLPYDPDVLAPDPPRYWIIEVSSFQATDLASSPPVVAVTSLHPDHLDWHGDVETYYRDKLSACTQPGADLTVADGTEPLLRERRSMLGPRVCWMEGEDGRQTAWAGALGLAGAHNRRNAAIARACLDALGVEGARDPEALAAAAAGFAGLDSRLRPIGVIGGVEFVDDSLSTNVLPTLAALESVTGRPVALIVGGHDRGIDYAELGRAVAHRKEPTLLVTLPEAGPRVAAEAEVPGRRHEVVACEDMDSAVAAAHDWSVPGGVVLLSPAAPSFGRFRDYKDRAGAFAAAMAACGPVDPPSRPPSQG